MNPYLVNYARRLIRGSGLSARALYRLKGVQGRNDFQEMDPLFDQVREEDAEATSRVLQQLDKMYLRVPEKLRMPADPFSPEYSERQRELYNFSAKRSYTTANEITPFDFEKTKDDFFPYSTRFGDLVAAELLSHGFLIRNMNLKPGSKIVEFGAGWGNATMHLAMMGHEMTAVELNPPSISLMRHRAGLHGKHIRLVEQDMVEFAEKNTERFDAALFVASLHHCHGHFRVLERLGDMINDGGRIFFAQEHVFPAPTPAFPYPWGILLDGRSLFYIRRYGWLEQGYLESYFREALRRTGWEVRKIVSTIYGVEDLFVAQRARRKGYQ